MDQKLFYLVDGKPRYLHRVNSARLVIPAKDRHLTHVASRLADSTRLGIDTQVPNRFLLVRGDSYKLNDLKNYPDIACTRGVYLDEDGFEIILTNDILVKLSSDTTESQLNELCEKLNCRIIENDNLTGPDNVRRLRVLDPNEDAPLEVANRLAAEKSIVFAEPDLLQTAAYCHLTLDTPNDQLFKNEWHLHNTGQGGGKAGADVNALEAWEVSQGSPEIAVVIHDSGVDINHPDLKLNINPGWDFDNDDPDASNNKGPHGTACAGVIASPVNGKGVVGIAPQCKITPLRAAGSLPISTWGETFLWAAKHGEIISCSWSIAPSNYLSECIRSAASSGRDGKGIPVFCATGNDGINKISYPASLPETIAVGASTNKDLRAGYSQYGPGIDFIAPSSFLNLFEGTLRIETTDVRGKDGYSLGDYCHANDSTGFGGTSSATPLAAGVAALILSVNPDLTAAQVRRIMRETAVKIDPDHAGYNHDGWSEKYGYGRIDAGKAVKMAQRM